MHRNLLRLVHAGLLEDESKRAGFSIFQRQLHFNLVRFHQLPVGLDVLVLRVLEMDGIDAACVLSLQVHRVVTPYDRGILIGGGDLPRLLARSLKMKGRTLEGFKTPVPSHRSLYIWAESNSGKRFSIHRKAALGSIGLERQVDLFIARLFARRAIFWRELQNHVTRVAGGEDQRSSIDR